MDWLKALGCFAGAFALSVIVFVIHNDDTDYIFPWTGSDGLKKRKDVAILKGFWDFYSGFVNHSLCSSTSKAYDSVLDPHYRNSPNPKDEDIRRIWYEFTKVYKCSQFDIYPKPGTEKLELYYYRGVPIETWEKMYPESVRYGLSPATKPYKIDHPYRIKPEGQRAKLVAKAQIGTTDEGPAYVKYDVVFESDRDLETITPDWSEVVASMDPEIKARVRHLVAPCSRKRFLEAYLSECEEPFEMVLSQAPSLQVDYHQFVGYKLKIEI